MIKNRLTLIVVCGAVAASGCSSSPKLSDHSMQEPQEKVLSRIDDLGSRPGWVKESEPFRIENGDVISIGQTTIPGTGHRLEAAYRIAQNNAKAGVALQIEQRLSYVFQQSSENTEIGSEQAKFIGAEASELTTSAIRPGKTYWEKVLVVDEHGQAQTLYRVFSSVTMKEADLKAAIQRAIAKNDGKKGISEKFAKQVDRHWESFVEGKPGEIREPAATPGD